MAHAAFYFVRITVTMTIFQVADAEVAFAAEQCERVTRTSSELWMRYSGGATCRNRFLSQDAHPA